MLIISGLRPAGRSGLALDLDWAALEHLVSAVAAHVLAGGVPDAIVGVLRGGIVPAVLLAHRLGVRTVRDIDIVRTMSEGAHAAKLAVPAVCMDAGLEDLNGRDVVLVDDVAGTGATFEAAIAVLDARSPARLRRAVVVVNTVNWADRAWSTPPGEFFDVVGTTCAGWVRFPWESR